MHTPSLTSTASFQALETHAIDAEDWQMRGLFGADPSSVSRSRRQDCS
jgi:glucose-6-phosphate isomerase